MQTSYFTSKRCELHNVLRSPMQLCRRAGLFPVEGLDNKNITGSRFNIRSAYALYYVTTLFGQLVLSCLTTYYFFTNDLGLDSFKYLMFYLTGFICAVLLWKLGRNWQQLITKANYLESRVAEIRTNIKKYDGIVYGVMILALLEHILSVTFQLKLIMVCYQDYDIDLDLMKNYFSKSFVFQLISYTEWKAVLYEVVNLQSTFMWNITDAMTMCISLYLTSYFQDLNKLIKRQEKQNVVNWKEIRLYYSCLVELVDVVDQNMCYLILMSFFTNLFFVCVQLFHLTNYTYPVLPNCKQEDIELVYNSIEHSVYYAYSFIFLFIRASVTSLLAANINTVAQKPLLVLLNVSASEYTIEVQRFIRQIRYTPTALSGVYFQITRGMILTVIATVIKYELVILQFSSIES